MTAAPPPAAHVNDDIPSAASSRKRGGQRGNRNAVKHGFYSNTFSRKDIQRLDGEVQGEFHDEEDLIRILMVRVAEAVKRKAYNDLENLVALRAICLGSSRIESIHRSRKEIYDKQTTLDKVLDELKYFPVEED
jgi:hypothetical protein